MNRRLHLSLLFVFIAIVIIGIGYGIFTQRQSYTSITDDSTVNIVASFYPLAHIAEQVTKNTPAHVSTVVPTGVEPHDFEPSAQDTARILSADLFLMNGAELEHWAEEITAKKFVMSNHVTLLPLQEEDDEHEEDADEDEHGAFDPHFWLDPVIVQTEVTVIADELSRLFPEYETQYQQNAASYIAELQQLDTAYQNGLNTCQIREIIVSHDAFSYLGERYDIELHAIAGLSPEEEPSARHIAELSTLATEKGITHIFFETLVSPKLAETIATEIGAETLVLNPLEGLTDEEQAAGKTYISVMNENLQNLRTAMQCQ